MTPIIEKYDGHQHTSLFFVQIASVYIPLTNYTITVKSPVAFPSKWFDGLLTLWAQSVGHDCDVHTEEKVDTGNSKVRQRVVDSNYDEKGKPHQQPHVACGDAMRNLRASFCERIFLALVYTKCT
ncbi:hypothetical protein Pcinc_025739 [Petrolisthes cinctipes]|uniref:Uncharacterized protein n=1 Tax=Petrolisthes cinctipes TaxID=88211 RepID=A0AAE1F7X7_PETCI|nr:hypothetical protein Pcinc_025739 [Petrolisthes cinctipes]